MEQTPSVPDEYGRLERQMLAERVKRKAELLAIQYENNPPHPGVYFREAFLAPGFGVAQVAEDLGVCRRTVSQIINERGGITAEMAVRLSIAYDEDPFKWLIRQMRHDLWKAEQKRDEIDFVMRRRRAFGKP